MKIARVSLYPMLLIVALTLGAYFAAPATNAQTLAPISLGPNLATQLQPDVHRVLGSRAATMDSRARQGGYIPAQSRAPQVRNGFTDSARSAVPAPVAAKTGGNGVKAKAAVVISPGTPLSRVLTTSQLSLVSAAGSDEGFVDTNSDLISDQRTTFDNAGGSFDIAVGQSGAHYEVYSATLQNTNVGVMVVGLDTNGDYSQDSSDTFNLQTNFSLPSAAAVVSGTAKSGREFVIISSSGYFNTADANDPNNEPSPGVILFVRNENGVGFDDSRSRTLVRVGDNSIYNANGLALLPNNDLLIADFHSDELRIIRDTDGDGIPDTLDSVPYYSYRFSDDAPLDLTVNSRGVVFSHTAGNDVVLLAIFDDNADGRGDRDEVAATGLSIDNNLFLHGLSVDREGNVYVIEDASGDFDGTAGNGGPARIDAFPDPGLNGLLRDGAVFVEADDAKTEGLSGLSFGALAPNPINDAQFFVRQHYLDFLDREPDPGGASYWTSQITQCSSDDLCLKAARITVSAAFFIEQEFQDTGSFVYRFYKASYGRRPNYAEFLGDRSQVVGGSNLEANKQAFANNWVNRTVFQQAYPVTMTSAQFVNKLFDSAGLIPFTSERQQLIADLEVGKTRAQAVRDVTEISQFKTAEYNPSFVLMQYFGYLHRDPDQGGYDFWLNVLNNREPNNYRGMVCSFITSREYQERTGLLLRRTNVDCQ
jgi:hypothetical protein